MLWDRMIVNNQWKSYDDPPDIPLITGGARRFQRRETISEAITGAALAFAKAISAPTNQQSTVQAAPKPPVQSGVSQTSKARLSSQYITQSHYKSCVIVVYSVMNFWSKNLLL